MQYKFNFRLQAAYGAITFMVSLIVLYLILNRLEWLTAFAVGLVNFLALGFCTDYCCKK